MSGRFLYFAYGSNMLTRRLVERTPSAIPAGTGYLTGRRLTFDKLGQDGSGKCDAFLTERPGDRVFGVTFEIRSTEREALDAAEGPGYANRQVEITTPAGVVEAMVYVALDKAPDILPFDWYRALTVAGALEHGLPRSWIERLRQAPAVPDPDRSRRRRHEALLGAAR